MTCNSVLASTYFSLPTLLKCLLLSFSLSTHTFFLLHLPSKDTSISCHARRCPSSHSYSGATSLLSLRCDLFSSHDDLMSFFFSLFLFYWCLIMSLDRGKKLLNNRSDDQTRLDTAPMAALWDQRKDTRCFGLTGLTCPVN